MMWSEFEWVVVRNVNNPDYIGAGYFKVIARTYHNWRTGEGEYSMCRAFVNRRRTGYLLEATIRLFELYSFKQKIIKNNADSRIN